MRINPRDLRYCLGHFTTGVTVVTCRADDRFHGVTINAFTAVSLDPPLVLVSLERSTRACRYLETTPFVVNVLTAEQRDLAVHFAGRPQNDVTIEWEEDQLAPRLVGCLGYISCTPWATYDGGDHVLHLGQVRHVECREGEPLVFYQGRFRQVGETFERPWIDSLDCPSGPSWLGPQHPSRVLASVD